VHRVLLYFEQLSKLQWHGVQLRTSTGRSSLQKNLNGEVHEWYRIILGFPDHLVTELLTTFGTSPGDLVIDPFCGAGTTLVECMKYGINSIGIDANPSSCFSAKVKTNWGLNPDRLLQLAHDIEPALTRYLKRRNAHRSDPTYLYLSDSGMLARNWISPKPLRKALGVKHSISGLKTTAAYRDALMLALLSEVIHGASNVKFGPELYCSRVRRDAPVFEGFLARVTAMASDLRAVARVEPGQATVIRGDSREGATFMRLCRPDSISYVICSPPYPTEHDYTRNSRLELAFLENVHDLESLRHIKKSMVRSHTKGIYTGDDDQSLVSGNGLIEKLAAELRRKVRNKSNGFARFYPKVITEYFGGMKRHFNALWPFLAGGAQCAYVVGDQSSYLRVHIPTALVLSQLASDVGFETVGIRHWRSRWSTTTARMVHENILLLRKPSAGHRLEPS
jgi:hypothetical protein